MQVHLEAIRQIGSDREADGAYHLEFATTDGTIEGRLHIGETANTVVIWTGVEHHSTEGVASLCVRHRYPQDIEQCVLDVLISIFAMTEAGFERIMVGGDGTGHDIAVRAADTSEKLCAVMLPNVTEDDLAAWGAGQSAVTPRLETPETA